MGSSGSVAGLFPEFGVALLQVGEELRVERRVAGGDGKVGGALEHEQFRSLFRDLWAHLDSGRPGADHAHPLPGEVHGLVRPVPGVVEVAGEVFEPWEVGELRDGELAAGHDEVAGADPVAVVGVDRPRVGGLVEGCRGHRGVEGDSAPQVEFVGDEVDVAQDLGLGSVPLSPVPLLEDLLGERVAVLDALDVAPRPRVAVPVPHTAHVASGFDDVHATPEFPQTVEGVQAGEAGSHDQDVHFLWWLSARVDSRLPGHSSLLTFCGTLIGAHEC